MYFVKRSEGPLPRDLSQPLLDHLTCGDVHPNILGEIVLDVETERKIKILLRSFLYLARGGHPPDISK